MTVTGIRAAMLCAALTVAGAAGAQDIATRLASADAAEGERLYRQCKACHTIESGAASRVGPNLYGVLGREVASLEAFRYSPALQDLGGAWTPEALDAYLEDPRATAPGNRMGFRGLPDAQDRAHLIAYLNANSDTPLTFAETASPAEPEPAGNTEEPEFGQLFVAPGVEDTYYACTACHSEMIVAQQGKTREGWDKMLDWMVEEQGMAELPENDRTIILDYLATHYNTDRPNFPRP